LLTALLLAGWGIAIMAGERLRAPRLGGVRTTPDRLAIGLIAAPAIAWLVFVAVYPFLWPAPVERTIALFTFRAEEMAHQGADWPSLAVESRTEAFQRVGETLGVRGDALGRLLATPLARVGQTDPPPPLDLPLAVVRGLILVTLAIGRGWSSPTALVSIVLAGQAAITLAGMRSAFDRYHVPIALLVVVCLGVLAGQLAARIPAVVAIVRRSPATPRRFRSYLTPAQPRHLHAAPLGRKLVAGTGYGEFARNRHPSRSSTPPRG
jgi:hypothetical protein